MSARKSVVVALVVVVAISLCAKDKKKQALPDLVLNAHTIYVQVDPQASDAMAHPSENQATVMAVERALMDWHRFSLAAGAQDADLVITVQKGHSGFANPTMRPPDSGGVDSSNGGVILRGQMGAPPPVNDPGLGGPQDTRTGPEMTMGQNEDVLKVYLGRTEYPLDSGPIWRYSGSDSLDAPRVKAVEEFRKAVEQSEKANASKP